MKTFNVFKRNKVFIPVIHLLRIEHALTNVEIVYKYCDCAMLVNNYCSSDVLIEAVDAIKAKYPNKWLGINILEDIGTLFFLFGKTDICKKINGLWMDNSFITDFDLEYQQIPRQILTTLKNACFEGVYFGSVFFKYVPMGGDTDKILKNATQLVDIVTTSGDGTGIPIPVNKIRKIHSSVGKTNYVAVCSGITATNIRSISDFCDIFVVGTAINDSNHNIVVSKLLELNTIIDSLN